MKVCRSIMAVSIALFVTSCATVQWTATEDDLSLLETAYRKLIYRFEPVDPVFLSTGFDQQRLAYENPPPAVFTRLLDLKMQLRGASEAVSSEAGVKEKETGKDAIVFVAHILQRNREGILLYCGYYKNERDSVGIECLATRSKGKWILTPTGKY